VCIDGTPPAYHMDPGFGAGKNKWIIDLEVLTYTYVSYTLVCPII
jgi:hypothetical protein